jgi:eukaryotic-like serine/threonine-protein kinase
MGTSGNGETAGDRPERVEGSAASWARVKAVFLEALDQPEADRSTFLAQACDGNEWVRQEVQSLLASDRAAGSFCETSAASLLQQSESAIPSPGPRLQAGSRLGAYEIVALLGAGGMGEVYRARDTRLRRDVAIKTIGLRSPDATARAHLLREARHTSTLRHPNICTVYEIAESDDLPYIVMEYVDGRSLSEIRRERQPGPAEAIAYGIQIADALEHAHQHGIVHRDLKSSNVVVDRSGRAIVLDFGLARMLPEAATTSTADPTLTTRYALAGTLSYMAPEALLGRRADARSDVWAIGVLLYEMATGALPFDGRTAFEMSSAIIGEPQRPLPRSVPLALRLVIGRCLVKDPAGRYQHAAEVGDALDVIRRNRVWPLVGRLLIAGRLRQTQGRHRRIARTVAGLAVIAVLPLVAPDLLRRLHVRSGAPSVSAIAVLPLENIGGDPDARYLVDGVTDSLVAQIGELGAARVISRSSTERLVRAGKTPREIGQALGAGAIVGGTLRRVGDRVDIMIRLTDAASGRMLWSDEFERAEREILVLQAAIVRALADGVQATLHPDVRERLTMVRAVEPRAYEAYLKGRFHWNHRTQQSLQLAIEQFARAVELDATFAPAHAALADCYNLLASVLVGGGSPRVYRPLAAAEAVKALQIDPDSAEAHAALGFVRHYDWRWEEAEREFRRAIELNPNYPLPRVWYAQMLSSRGRFDEALREAYIGRELDPFSLIMNTNVGWMLDLAGRHEEAVAHLTRTLELDPDYPQVHKRLSDALANVGRLDAALQHARRFVELTNRSPWSVGMVAELHARAGDRNVARALVKELVDMARRQYVPPDAADAAYMALGEHDAALDSLEKGYEERSNQIAFIAVLPVYAPIRSHPRFQSLLERSGLR